MKDARPHPTTVDGDRRVTVVVLTYDRAHEVERTLARLASLPERPRVVVVDNGSHDDTARRVRDGFPDAALVRSRANLGAAGRNLGVAEVRSPYVAFCDDDTWWEAGALSRAADLLDGHPRVGALSARVLVGDANLLDPACERMAASPLDAGGLPGPALITFMAGAAVMRVDAYRQVGGYEPRLFLGAEEQLLAFDLLARGWHLVYADDVVTHHHPSSSRDPARRATTLRNRLWIAWLRLPLASAVGETRNILREARAARLLAHASRDALAGLPWVLRQRRVLPPHIDAMHARIFRPARR